MTAFWIAVLVSIIPLWLLQNVIHELAHGLTMYFGWKWNFSIYPFPSKKLGRFTFAHCTYERTENSKDLDEKGRALVSIMPKIVNAVFIILAQIIAVATTSLPILSAILLVFAWCNYIDFTVGICTLFRSEPKETADLWRFQSYLNIPVNQMRMMAIGLLVYLAVPMLIGTVICLIV
jgi:hypothetical protein